MSVGYRHGNASVERELIVIEVKIIISLVMPKFWAFSPLGLFMLYDQPVFAWTVVNAEFCSYKAFMSNI